jgi:hypothetical protein
VLKVDYVDSVDEHCNRENVLLLVFSFRAIHLDHAGSVLILFGSFSFWCFSISRFSLSSRN